MDVLVLLEDRPEHSNVVAHVNSVRSAPSTDQRSRAVVTLFGLPTVDGLATALAAAVESRRELTENPDTIRHLSLWPDRGAVGDMAWREAGSGRLMTRDLSVPADVLEETAGHLLRENGVALQRLLAGLSMPDWPEGAQRALTFTLSTSAVVGTGAREGFLDSYRSADGIGTDTEGD